MATKQPAVAVDHPTVVPENYDREDDESADGESVDDTSHRQE